MDDVMLRIVALVLLIAVLIGISGYQMAHEPKCPARIDGTAGEGDLVLHGGAGEAMSKTIVKFLPL